MTYIFLLSAVQHLSLHPLQKPQLLLATPSVCISALIHFSTFSRPGLLFVWSMTYLDASLQPKKRVSRIQSWDQCQTSFLKNNIDFFFLQKEARINQDNVFFSFFIADGVWRIKAKTLTKRDEKKLWRINQNIASKKVTRTALSAPLISLAFTHGQIVNECSIKSNDAEGSGLALHQWIRSYVTIGLP